MMCRICTIIGGQGVLSAECSQSYPWPLFATMKCEVAPNPGRLKHCLLLGPNGPVDAVCPSNRDAFPRTFRKVLGSMGREVVSVAGGRHAWCSIS